MNRAFPTTLLMLGVAVVAAFAASSVYPWPEAVVISDAVDKPLFDGFDNEIERLLVRRKGEEWVLPTHSNFVADNGLQLGAIVNLLLDKTVLEKRSDNQEDHLKYGVVDPVDFNSAVNRSSLGKKISLSDRNNKELASLIVGLPLKNDPKRLKHYVRIPGQPSVYVVDIDPRGINPDFTAWVSPNLLKLSKSSRLKDVTVDSYRLDLANIDQASRVASYRSQLVVNEQKIDVILETATETGKLNEIQPDKNQEKAIQGAAGSITSIPFSGIVAKNKLAAKSLRSPTEKSEALAFDSMKKRGFRVTQFDNETWQFDSSEGSVTVRTGDGVVVTLHIGALGRQRLAKSVPAKSRRAGPAVKDRSPARRGTQRIVLALVLHHF